eukprot:CAMPEP_0114539336 /NCGR_PEP_ID=MMETSP0114-20121206/183_1 /TAXON_ID=31324 /ORGANISM="Goniomonas sp, Strain m" /LENGTH=231 /DNA_ID=CAMNT_0001723431 /DNA_START=139 /DNA_END=835 /DNA_ORIENTATION=-
MAKSPNMKVKDTWIRVPRGPLLPLLCGQYSLGDSGTSRSGNAWSTSLRTVFSTSSATSQAVRDELLARFGLALLRATTLAAAAVCVATGDGATAAVDGGACTAVAAAAVTATGAVALTPNGVGAAAAAAVVPETGAAGAAAAAAAVATAPGAVVAPAGAAGAAATAVLLVQQLLQPKAPAEQAQPDPGSGSAAGPEALQNPTELPHHDKSPNVRALHTLLKPGQETHITQA